MAAFPKSGEDHLTWARGVQPLNTTLFSLVSDVKIFSLHPPNMYVCVFEMEGKG